ncbi:MAG: peroxidase family protein [Caulobacteraceae bacterium]
MAARHSSLHRGQDAAGDNPNLQDARFGRLFPNLPAAKFAESDLDALARKMVSPFDPPKDAPDDEESGIPALYTYLGQFIDHDLTFGPEGSFQKQKDPSATVDFRTPAFDLDNVYGRGPGDQPYMYAADGRTFLLGEALIGGAPGARDLQRNAAGRALIGDPRNDENAIVSQLQALVLRFHNNLAAKHPHLPFEEVQALVRHHYQYVVVNDFLPRLVNAGVLNQYRSPHGRFEQSKLKYFTGFGGQVGPYMPLEFSVAASRFGHSMVRPGYRLNDSTLLPIFPIPNASPHPKFTPRYPEGLTGFRAMINGWAIQWGRFIDLDLRDYGAPLPDPGQPPLTDQQLFENFGRLQFAYRIDTALVDPLGSLPDVIAGAQAHSLALRNLKRGVSYNLPSGQEVAAAMQVDVLQDEDIVIGQAIDGKTNPSITAISAGFAKTCPLWTYVLAEAAANPQSPKPSIPAKGGQPVTTPQLGPVGGGIVTEVFLGLMFADPSSYLHSDPGWTPEQGPDFKLKDFVAMALA